MTDVFAESTPPSLRHVRLDTLVRLRWLAVLGQTAAVLVVYDGFDFEVPFWACLGVIATYAATNIALRMRFRLNQRLEPHQAAWLLALDIIELAGLLFLTGGLQNPFSFLLATPVLISAAALPKRMTLILGALVFVCATVLVRYYYPLPWPEEEPLELPPLYMIGVWLSLMLAIGYTSIYAWQIIEESRQLSDALAATELVLTREHYLSQLDGLAAAAAHELGTPLSTILVVAREIERELERTRGTEPMSRFADDIRLLREQAQRCGGDTRQTDRVAGAGRAVRADEALRLDRGSGGAESRCRRRDRRQHRQGRSDRAGRGAQSGGSLRPRQHPRECRRFRARAVQVTAKWDQRPGHRRGRDDGSGFPPEIIDRMGEPYVTS